MADSDYQLNDVLETYRLDGSLIRQKARVLTEAGLDRAYAILMDPDTPRSVFIDLMKYLMTLGDMVPKQTAQPQQGPAFSIQINIPGQSQPMVIDATPVAAATNPIDADPTELPPLPDHLAKLAAFTEQDLA